MNIEIILIILFLSISIFIMTNNEVYLFISSAFL